MICISDLSINDAINKSISEIHRSQCSELSKHFTIYGNCQASALSKTLLSSNKFSKKYVYIPIKAVHELVNDDIKQIHKILPTLDLFIFIKVNATYKGQDYSTDFLCSLLKKDCIIMSFPCCYFNPYSPEIKYASVDQKHLIVPTDLHDHKLIEYYINNNKKINIDDFKNKYLLNENLYTKDYLINLVNNSIKELKKRESEIKNAKPLYISEYINNNYKKIRLFTIYNHPTYYLFNHIANQVLKYLDIDDNIKTEINYLSWMPFIYKSVHKHLELQFENVYDHCIVIDKKLTLQEFVDYYSNHYNKISNIDKINSVIW
jgi:hypothetical protein